MGNQLKGKLPMNIFFTNKVQLKLSTINKLRLYVKIYSIFLLKYLQ